MKMPLLGLFLAFSILNGAACQSRGPDWDDPQLPEVRAVLLDMEAEDQRVRQELIAAGIEQPDPALLAQMIAVDQANLERLQEIVTTYGWPSPAQVGRDGLEAAFLLLQHGNLDFQQAMLPAVEACWRRGELEGQDYALLYDRVAIGQGRPQEYGTQLTSPDLWAEEGVQPLPLRDPDGVDARRAELGLPPLADYLRMAAELYRVQTPAQL